GHAQDLLEPAQVGPSDERVPECGKRKALTLAPGRGPGRGSHRLQRVVRPALRPAQRGEPVALCACLDLGDPLLALGSLRPTAESPLDEDATDEYRLHAGRDSKSVRGSLGSQVCIGRAEVVVEAGLL